MTTKRLAVVVLMVAAALAITFLLPKSSAQPTGLLLVEGNPVLPAKVGNWTGTDLEITQKEIDQAIRQMRARWHSTYGLAEVG